MYARLSFQTTSQNFNSTLHDFLNEEQEQDTTPKLEITDKDFTAQMDLFLDDKNPKYTGKRY